ncbi:hypothetical protein B9Z19DRAFT_1138063 [Tuber borchii]|uniref:Cysteine-rich transmembrane CYSTM domain-containing protein n=1 Tax=Tuber borchii TaxID=42251 RepID=A0A2T6ZA11_TUBBO|nr:hypothetical protein B9Z19DRAFT_1138063 [Tuber borchii]
MASTEYYNTQPQYPPQAAPGQGYPPQGAPPQAMVYQQAPPPVQEKSGGGGGGGDLPHYAVAVLATLAATVWNVFARRV